MYKVKCKNQRHFNQNELGRFCKKKRPQKIKDMKSRPLSQKIFKSRKYRFTMRSSKQVNTLSFSSKAVIKPHQTTSSSRYCSFSNTMICTNNHCFSYKFRLTSRLCKTLYATETFQLNLVFILWQQKNIPIAVIVRYGYVTQTAAVYVSCCKSSSVAAVSTFLRPQPPIKSPIVLTIILL